MLRKGLPVVLSRRPRGGIQHSQSSAFSESAEDSTSLHGLLYEIPRQGSIHLRPCQKQQLFHAGSSEEVSIWKRDVSGPKSRQFHTYILRDRRFNDKLYPERTTSYRHRSVEAIVPRLIAGHFWRIHGNESAPAIIQSTDVDCTHLWSSEQDRYFAQGF